MAAVLCFDGADARLSNADLKTRSLALVKDLGLERRPPLRLVSFDC